MSRAPILVGLLAFVVAYAAASSPILDNEEISSVYSYPVQGRQVNGGPPEFPVADNLDLSFRLLENMDVKGNQITSLLVFKFARLLGLVQDLKSDIGGLGDKVMDLPQLDIGDNFDMLKDELADVEKFVKGAIEAAKKEIIDEVDIRAEAVVGKIVDTEDTLLNAVGKSKDDVINEVADAEKFIKGAVKESTEEVIEKVGVVGEALAGKIVDTEHTVLEKVEDSTKMKMEKLMAVEEAIEKDIAASTSQIKNAVIYVGKKVSETVTDAKKELSNEIDESTDEVVQKVADSKKYLYAAISATGVYLEKSIDKSTEEILDKIMDGPAGGGGGSVAEIADAVEENTDSALAQLEHDLKKFIHERLSPISQGVQYLTERAYANSVGIRYIKKVLKQMASHGCYGKSGSIQLDDEDDLDDEPKELKLRYADF